MNNNRCNRCSKFLPADGIHDCHNNGGGAYSRESKVPGEGSLRKAYYGGDDGFNRLQNLLRSVEGHTMKLEGLRLLYMAQEAGCMQNVPLASLRKFADLIRADMRAEQHAENLREIEQAAAMMGTTL